MKQLRGLYAQTFFTFRTTFLFYTSYAVVVKYPCTQTTFSPVIESGGQLTCKLLCILF